MATLAQSFIPESQTVITTKAEGGQVTKRRNQLMFGRGKDNLEGLLQETIGILEDTANDIIFLILYKFRLLRARTRN